MKVAEQETAAALIPPDAGLDELRGIAAGCRACDLWARGTQTVFGDGPKRARLMLVGEQPGDAEDETGHPFVGPAGHLLDRALERAGIDREDAYLTNAVKHFKWEPRGKRRIHSKPNGAEIRACKPWLQREIELVAPEALVLLGATAAQALLGSGFRVTLHRGEFVESGLAPFVLATVHPSSILRAPDDDARHAAMEAFVADLELVRTALGEQGGRPAAGIRR